MNTHHKTNSLCLILCLTLAPAWGFAAAPELQIPSELTVLTGAPLHIPLLGSDADGDDLTFSVSVSQPGVLEAFVPEGNRSLELDIADFGTMAFELFEQRAPRPAGHIIELAESGFYDGIIFHRVIDNFVLQGGDPTGTGTGGSTLGEFDDQFHVDLLHTGPGILSMAKSSDDTNDSQFFITELATPWLDFNHSIFGRMTEGASVLEAISNVPTDGRDKPVEDVVITQARVVDDNQNGVLMLKALDTISDKVQVDVTVSDGTESVTQSMQISFADDPQNQQPFLADFPELQTFENTTLEFQMFATDIEGDDIFYAVQSREEGIEVSVNPSGLVSVIPPQDFRGQLEVFVAASATPSIQLSRSDIQRLTVDVVPEPAARTLVLFAGGTLCVLRRRRPS